MKMKRIGKRLILTAIAATAISMPAVQMSAPLSVYADEEKSEIPDISGGYTDREGYFQSIEVTRIPDDRYQILLTGPVDEDGRTCQWLFKGALNPDTMTIQYTEGMKYLMETSTAPLEIVYDNGEGSLLFKDGTVVWSSDLDFMLPTNSKTWDKTVFNVKTSVQPDKEDGKTHGTVKVDKSTAKAGDTVIVTVEPADGYYAPGVSVVADEEVAVKEDSESTYSFTMPASDVEVCGVFKEIPDTPEFTGHYANANNPYQIMTVEENDKGGYDVITIKKLQDDAAELWKFSGDYDPITQTIDFSKTEKYMIEIDGKGEPEIIEQYTGDGGALVYKEGVFFLNFTDEPDEEPIKFVKLEEDYNVNLDDTVNGRIKASRATAYPGARIIIDAIPDEGYVVKRVFYVDDEGNTVTADKVDDDTYAFYMPEGDVRVGAEFITAEEAGDDGTNAGENGTENGDGAAGTGTGGDITDGGNAGVAGAVGTGDSSMLPLWISLGAAAAGVGITTAVIKTRKSEK